MPSKIKTYEEFIGDYQVRNLRKKNSDDEENEIVPGLDMNDPTRSYDDEYDGDDQINRHTINF